MESKEPVVLKWSSNVRDFYYFTRPGAGVQVYTSGILGKGLA